MGNKSNKSSKKSPFKAEASIQENASTIFKLLDTDNNGRLDLKELASLRFHPKNKEICKALQVSERRLRSIIHTEEAEDRIARQKAEKEKKPYSYPGLSLKDFQDLFGPPGTFNLKLGIFGETGVGKTSLTTSFTGKYNPDRCGIRNVEYGDQIVAKMQVWDTSPQEMSRNEGHYIYRDYRGPCHGVILVFDLTNRKSWTMTSKWLQEFDRYVPDAPRVVVGMKNDLPVSGRVVPEADIKEFCENNDFMYMEASNVTGYNIDDIFFDLGARVLTRFFSCYGVDGCFKECWIDDADELLQNAHKLNSRHIRRPIHVVWWAIHQQECSLMVLPQEIRTKIFQEYCRFTLG